jgi:phosphatidylglycerol:prolipoprotein diacylglycerol transferase
MDLALLNDLYLALDPVAFWIGPFAVRWYGLAYILGILAGGFVLLRVCKRWQIRFTLDALLTLFVAAIVGIIGGARLGYVLFYGAGFYFEHPLEIVAFVNGGMSFHGGVIGMVVALLVASRLLKLPFATLGDLVAIVAPLGLLLGRLANFINGELWGAPTTLPWGVEFASGGGIARHPTQLYEALLEGVVLFVLMMLLARRKPPLPRGSYMGVFLILYGVFRIAVEFVREPDVQLGYLAGGWLTMGMVLCLPMLAIGAALLVYARKTRHPQEGLPALATAAAVDAGYEAEASDEELSSDAPDKPVPSDGEGKPERPDAEAG